MVSDGILLVGKYLKWDEMMGNKKKWVVFLFTALGLQVIAQILTVALVLRLNILPGKYIAVLIPAMALMAAITGLVAFLPIKGKVRLWRKIISVILTVMILCGCGLVCKVCRDASSLIDNVTDTKKLPSTRNTYVLVMNEDPAQALADTKGYAYGAVENYNVEHTDQMITDIELQLMLTLNLQYYDRASIMATALYSGEIGAVIMDGASIAFLTEETGFADFLDRVRVLYTLSIETTTVPEETAPPEEIIIKPFVVYISGSDTRNDFLDVSLSDVNILAVVDPQGKQILLLNTPRDYFVPNPAGNGALDKLTHCGRYGIDCSVQTLEDLYDIKIDYYGRINFKGFERLVDAIGGINFDSDKAFIARDTNIKVGNNYLTGAQALDVARERYHVSGGDNGRGKNQMKLIKAIFEKVSSSSTLIFKYSDILSSLEGMVATSFRPEEISALVKMQLGDMAKWTVHSFAVTGSNGSEITYSYRGEELYVMWPDKEMVEYASVLVQRVLNGELLTEEDITVS